MRIIIVAIFAAFCVLGPVSMAAAGAYQGAGAYVGTPSPAVTRMFAAFPNGGDGLMAAIREILINDPTLADDVAFVASRGNAAQQDAAAAGMAQAVITLNSRGNNAGGALIASAVQSSGNAVLQTVVLAAFGGTNSSVTTSNQCNTVSPSRPGGNC